MPIPALFQSMTFPSVFFIVISNFHLLLTTTYVVITASPNKNFMTLVYSFLISEMLLLTLNLIIITSIIPFEVIDSIFITNIVTIILTTIARAPFDTSAALITNLFYN